MGNDTARVAAKQTAAQWRADLARERQLQPTIDRARQEAARLAFRRVRDLLPRGQRSAGGIGANRAQLRRCGARPSDAACAILARLRGISAARQVGAAMLAKTRRGRCASVPGADHDHVRCVAGTLCAYEVQVRTWCLHCVDGPRIEAKAHGWAVR
jgi:hypothetical protein